MGSVGTENEKKEMVTTQASIGGFDHLVSAKVLTDFLEDQIGVIWRCRLKNSCTPLKSYPSYNIANTANNHKTDEYEKVPPHAFVHFATPEAAIRAWDAAKRFELVFNKNPLIVNLGSASPFHMNQRRKTTLPFKFCDVRFDIGSLVSGEEFLAGWKGPNSGAHFVVDPYDGTCKIIFTKETAFPIKGTVKHTIIKCDFKIEFFAGEITDIKQYKERSSLIILLQLTSSPCVFYRTANDDIYAPVPFSLLDDEDPWIRTTDFTPGGVIGRCNSYRISLSPRVGHNLENAIKVLKDLGIPHDCPKEKLRVSDEPDYGMLTSEALFSIQFKNGISFEIMFLVNCVMHKGIVNHHQLSDTFFELLRSQRREVNIAALKHIYSYSCPVFDACESLKLVQEGILKNPVLLETPKRLDDYVEVWRLVITPTRAYCLPPEVELSNRVLRKYKEVADRFLRVTFMDEGMQKLNSNVLNSYFAPIVKDITSKSFPQKTNVFYRFKTFVNDGVYLCGRKYSFLAYSSNQLKDSSAWFFANDENINVVDVTNWMGKFRDSNVAKYTARMGLCFSSTYATVEVPLEEVDFELPDIKRNDYVFSDGIGKLTPDLAIKVAQKLQLNSNPPSAYQIRFDGCKGVIACWPGKDVGKSLSLRPSMNKFSSNHNVIEVVSWTKFQPGFLNRQIIILLSALEVQDDVFSRMQDSMVQKLDQMLENTDVAIKILTSSCGEQGNTAAMMLCAGFKPQGEPHLKGMLSSIRTAQLGDLLTKARIFVPRGRWLMGCLDELGVLEHGQCFIQVSTPSLENCSSKHGPGYTKKNVQVVKGTVVIAKNPCLHPGDIRILEAVDAPGLHHLVDCLIFPQKGDRPHTYEASGSDLDGDIYFATWDRNLIPPSKKSREPMDYSPAEAKKLSHEVSSKDRKDFFTKNMVNETLGTICHAHVVHSDLSNYGALDEKCIELAKLAAKAVDFPKTGLLVTMPQSLKPKMYPDFMGKADFLSYKSDKILGKLYRMVKDMSDGEILSTPEDIPFDIDLCIPGSSQFILDAWSGKCSYDGQLYALLGRYSVNKEGEVVTGHIFSMPKHNSWKQGQLKEKLMNAYNALKKEFNNVFENLGPDFDQLTEAEKYTLYEQKASAWYQVTYDPRWVEESSKIRYLNKDCAPALLSFAWIPVDYLVRIKLRSRKINDLDTQQSNKFSWALPGLPNIN